MCSSDLEAKLNEEQISYGEIYFATSEKLDLTEFSLKESHNRQSGDSSKTLYRAATTTFATLRKASMRKCDLFIAVNHEENVNIIAAMLAKKLGARKSIARIDNNEYLEPNNKEAFIDMGIDYLFYPEKVAAREVINLLGHTSTTEYVDFSGGKLSLAVFRLEASSPLVGRTPTGADGDEEPAQPAYRVVALTRGGQTIIPRSGERLSEGDVVYVIARQDAVREIGRAHV